MTEYRDVEGFPAYRVGDDGSVWSRWKRTGRHRWMFGEWRRLSQKTSKGYLSVTLRQDCKPHHKRVSRLVCEAFHGPRPIGMECRHLNGVKEDNTSINLAWGTHQENMDDQIAHGTRLTGVTHPQAKFSQKDIILIRCANDAGLVSTEKLAKLYGCGKATIGRIVRRESYCDIPDVTVPNEFGKKCSPTGKRPTSRFPGVSRRADGKWVVAIGHVNLCSFDEGREIDAGAAYAEAKALRDSGGTREDIAALAVERGWRKACSS